MGTLTINAKSVAFGIGDVFSFSPVALLELSASGCYNLGYLTTTAMANRDIIFEALNNIKNSFNELNK